MLPVSKISGSFIVVVITWNWPFSKQKIIIELFNFALEHLWLQVLCLIINETRFKKYHIFYWLRCLLCFFPKFFTNEHKLTGHYKNILNIPEMIKVSSVKISPWSIIDKIMIVGWTFQRIIWIVTLNSSKSKKKFY